MDQVLQVIGALLVLSGFALAQFRLLDQRSYAYLALNLVGSAVLAVLAWEQRQWGFILLEGAWALISLLSVAVRLLGRDTAASQLAARVVSARLPQFPARNDRRRF